jgi:hypothetical protein
VFVEHVRRDRLDAFDFHLVFFRFELVFTPVTLLSTTIHSRLLLGVFWVQKPFGQRELFRLADVFAHNVYVYFLSLYEENVPFRRLLNWKKRTKFPHLCSFALLL